MRRWHIILVALATGIALLTSVATARPSATKQRETKAFARGKLTRTVDGVRFTLYVPKTGWETGPVEKIADRFRTRGLLISKSTRGGQAAEEVIYWIGIHGNGDVTPCSKVLPSAADLSTADLAAAIARAPGTKLAGGPRSDSTVGVLPAASVVVRVKENLGCQPGYFFRWPHSGCFGACWRRTDVGDSIGVKIVEVSGKRLLFVAITKPGAGEHQEIGDIVRSVRFG